MALIRLTRRELLKKMGVGAAAVAITSRPLLADFGTGRLEPIPPIRDTSIKALALRALEASRAAGADYADVRLTHERERKIGSFRGLGFNDVMDQETLHVGVRVLVGGGWGFASSGLWTPDEMARLGREAAAQAKAIATLGQAPVALAPVVSVANGHWATPVLADPFEVSPFDMEDIVADKLQELTKRSKELGFAADGVSNRYCMQAKVFASTDGSYCSQQLYRSHPSIYIQEMPLRNDANGRSGSGPAFLYGVLPIAGVGWEVWRDLDMAEAFAPVAKIIKALALPPRIDSIDVGRYEAVVSPVTMANLIHQTLGRATELDRAMGYEANAGGTSYINDPMNMLGKYQVGSDLLTVKADRSDPQGCATVRWDDEGVPPADFPLVEKGVVTDFLTTRESAMWLHEAPGRRQQPPRSHGCAYAPTAHLAPLTHIPNLTMAPGPENVDFFDFVGQIKDGIAVTGPHVEMDFQGLNGSLSGVLVIKDGKPTGWLSKGKVLFRTPELWKGLKAVGGAASVRPFGLSSAKGQPEQESWCTVKAPPALFKQLTLIDGTRR